MAKRSKRTAAPVQDAPVLVQDAVAEASAPEAAAEDTSILLEAGTVSTLDTDTLRTLADGVAGALQDGDASSAEQQQEWQAFVAAARAELRTRDHGAMAAARDAAALAAQERAAKLASMAEASAPAQEDSSAPAGVQDGPVCVHCGATIQDAEYLLVDNGGGLHLSCQEAYSAAIAATQATQAARSAAPRVQPPTQAGNYVVGSLLYGHPVPPARKCQGWSVRDVDLARDAIHAGRMASGDVPPAEATECSYCLQPYRDNSITVVGTTGWSYHRVCADYCGYLPRAVRTAPAAPAAQVAQVSADVAAMQAAMLAMQEQMASMARMLAEATAPAARTEAGAA